MGGNTIMKIRTRYAPSPTGRMHVGNLRTALYAYLIAKHEDGDFILRIEDTDQGRYVEGAVDIIKRTMADTGLIEDEGPDKDGGVGPYVQSERMRAGIYGKYAQKLIDKGEAYRCFCTPERLATLTQVVEGKEISVYDKHCLHLSEEEIRGGGHLHAVDLGGLDGDHGTGEIRLPDFTIADDHHFIQEFTVLGEREDLGKFAGFEGDGRVTDATDLDDGIRRGDRQGVGSVLVGGRPSGRPLFAHSRTDDRSVLVRNHALDRVALRKGGHSCCHEQRGEKR